MGRDAFCPLASTHEPTAVFRKIPPRSIFPARFFAQIAMESIGASRLPRTSTVRIPGLRARSLLSHNLVATPTHEPANTPFALKRHSQLLKRRSQTLKWLSQPLKKHST